MCHFNYFKLHIFAPPIFRAARKGDAAKLKKLLAAKSNVNIHERDGSTPLMVASLHGNIEAVQLLVQHGADVNAQDKNGMTPLAFASISSKKFLHSYKKDRHDMIAKNLMINVDGTPNYTIHYPPYLDSYTDVAKILVQNGADVHLGDSKAHTPLMHAAFSGNDKLVEFLLSSGTDVNAKNYEGVTPLMMSLVFNSSSSSYVAKMLIEHGADVNAADKDGFSVMMMAVAKDKQQIMQLLREKGAKGDFISCCSKKKRI